MTDEKLSLEEVAAIGMRAKNPCNAAFLSTLTIKAGIAEGNFVGAKKVLLEAISKGYFEEKDAGFVDQLREKGMLSDGELSEVANNLLRSLTSLNWTWSSNKHNIAAYETPLWVFRHKSIMQYADRNLAGKAISNVLHDLIENADPNNEWSFYGWSKLRFKNVQEFIGKAEYNEFVTDSVIVHAVAERFAGRLIYYGVGNAAQILNDKFFGKYRDDKEIEQAIARRTAEVTLPELKSVEYYIKSARKGGFKISVDDVVKSGWENALRGTNLCSISRVWLDPQLRPYFERFNGAMFLKSILEKDLSEQNVDQILWSWLKPPLRRYFEELGGERAMPYLALERLASERILS